MGREIRRVPPNWQHPTRQRYNYATGQTVEDYQPLYDEDFETAMKEWLAGLKKWLGGGFAKWRKKNPDSEFVDEPYAAYCEWERSTPDREYYRRPWKEEPTWYQAYSTVSEGTPTTPPFATKEELIDYLATHGDFWDQDRRARGVKDIDCGPWKRENAEKFVNAGFAMSMIVQTSPDGVTIKQPRDGID